MFVLITVISNYSRVPNLRGLESTRSGGGKYSINESVGSQLIPPMSKLTDGLLDLQVRCLHVTYSPGRW